jgi:hypothetical protein
MYEYKNPGLNHDQDQLKPARAKRVLDNTLLWDKLDLKDVCF